MRTDEDLLLSGDAEDFGLFYDRYVDMLLGYFARRVSHPEVAADLTAETFAAALASRKRFRRAETPAVAWLFGIAQHKLADYRRRGSAEDRMRRRLGYLEADLDAPVATGYDPLVDDTPELARTLAASMQQRLAFGERAG